MRSHGRIFQRGARWWIAYYTYDPDLGRNREYRESAGREEGDAKRLLRQRIAEIYGEKFIGPEAERLVVGELLDAYSEHLCLAGKKSITRGPNGLRGSVMTLVRALKASLAGVRAKELTTTRIRRYMTARLEAGYARATVQLEVSYLRAAFHLAHREGRLRALPYFPSLEIRNARKVFYEPGEIQTLIAKLPDPLNDLVLGYYLTGRRKMELSQARWEWVDRGARTLTIPDTKNGDPAVLPLEGELGSLIERRWRAREVKRPDGTVLLSPWIFHRRGKPIRKFSRAFDIARTAAGVPHKTVHDFRRTALRDFIRAGVHQHVAMQMSGHRSASVFRRYDIIDVEDVRQALRKTERYREARTETDSQRIVRL
jgi:integrase